MRERGALRVGMMVGTVYLSTRRGCRRQRGGRRRIDHHHVGGVDAAHGHAGPVEEAGARQRQNRATDGRTRGGGDARQRRRGLRVGEARGQAASLAVEVGDSHGRRVGRVRRRRAGDRRAAHDDDVLGNAAVDADPGSREEGGARDRDRRAATPVAVGRRDTGHGRRPADGHTVSLAAACHSRWYPAGQNRAGTERSHEHTSAPRVHGLAPERRTLGARGLSDTPGGASVSRRQLGSDYAPHLRRSRRNR